MGILCSPLAPPCNVASIEAKAFHPDHFLDADWETMKRSNRPFVLNKVVIEVLGSTQGSLGQKFCDTICLKSVNREDL